MKTGLQKMVEWWKKSGKNLDPNMLCSPASEICAEMLRLLEEEKAHKPTADASLVEGLCGSCNGSGLVQIAPNVRGMHTCPTCKGKGKMTGLRPAPSCEGLVEELREEMKRNSNSQSGAIQCWMIEEILCRYEGEDNKGGV